MLTLTAQQRAEHAMLLFLDRFPFWTDKTPHSWEKYGLLIYSVYFSSHKSTLTNLPCLTSSFYVGLFKVHCSYHLCRNIHIQRLPLFLSVVLPMQNANVNLWRWTTCCARACAVHARCCSAMLLFSCLALLRAADDDGKTGILACIKSTTTNGSSGESSNIEWRRRFRGCSVPVIMDGYVDLYKAQMEALYNYEIPVIRQLQLGWGLSLNILWK